MEGGADTRRLSAAASGTVFDEAASVQRRLDHAAFDGTAALVSGAADCPPVGAASARRDARRGGALVHGACSVRRRLAFIVAALPWAWRAFLRPGTMAEAGAFDSASIARSSRRSASGGAQPCFSELLSRRKALIQRGMYHCSSHTHTVRTQ